MRKHFDWIFPMLLVGLIAMVGLIGPRPAAAWTDVNVVISTAMPSRVVVASATTSGAGATRIDNWNRGVQGTTSSTLLSGRVGLCCMNVSTMTARIFFGFNSSVSTQATASFLYPGWFLDRGDAFCRDVDRGLQVHALAEDAVGATGASLACDQVGRNQ